MREVTDERGGGGAGDGKAVRDRRVAERGSLTPNPRLLTPSPESRTLNPETGDGKAAQGRRVAERMAAYLKKGAGNISETQRCPCLKVLTPATGDGNAMRDRRVAER